MANSLFSSLLKNVPAASSVAIEGTSSSEFGGFVDTGSYSLNSALSGTLFGGIPDNKITVFAGESGVGKSFFIIGVLREWMERNPTGVVIYCDTESAITNSMMSDRGLDLERVVKVEPETIEQFRQSVLAILDNYEESKSPYPLIVVVDSLGNLSSLKEIQDVRDQRDSRDMTKAGLIRGTFRVLRLRLSKLKVPMLVSQHVYSIIGAYVPTKAISGGAGLIYVSDSIAMLTRSKEKDKEKNIIGSIIHVKMYKSRLSRENTSVDVRISYEGGLDRYYGILDMAVDAGMVENAAGRYTFPGQKAATAAKIAEAPETYFTKEFLETLDEAFVKPNFSYGRGVLGTSITEAE